MVIIIDYSEFARSLPLGKRPRSQVIHHEAREANQVGFLAGHNGEGA